jgi:hypothetical protein
MANYVTIILDTTEPSSPSLSIDGGNTYATAQLVDLTIGTTDPDTTGYQMLLWGDVDGTFDTNIQSEELNSTWITFNPLKQVKLASGDAQKTVYVKIRDKVHNVSSQASDSIILDTSKPTVTTTAPDIDTISKQPNKNEASFTFTVDKVFVEYKVKVVSSTGAAENTGTTLGTVNGSTNTSGTGTFSASTPITVTVTGADLELASSGDGEKYVKVFCLDESGKWSA